MAAPHVCSRPHAVPLRANYDHNVSELLLTSWLCQKAAAKATSHRCEDLLTSCLCRKAHPRLYRMYLSSLHVVP